MDFWNLETYPGNSMDFIKPFVQKLTPGKQFRWREDPTGTVYTVVKQVQQYNRLNLSPSFSHLDGDDNYTDDVDDNNAGANNAGANVDDNIAAVAIE